MANPLRLLLNEGLPEIDFGVMSHGFAKHGRDYVFVIEDCISGQPGTHRLTFTHVVELNFVTAVEAEVWQKSWTDEFIDYSRWQKAGEPDGYVFGTDWSLAYPGLAALEDDASAALWSEKLERPMYAATVQTDRFRMTLVFNDVHLEQIDDRADTVSRVINPLPPG